MIYLDYAATSPIRQEVLEVMWPFMSVAFGNPSSQHEIGRIARVGFNAALNDVSQILNCTPSEVVFTSGGTESNNLAIRGVLDKIIGPREIVTTSIEHKATLETCKNLAANGAAVKHLTINNDGLVDLDFLSDTVTKSTSLVTLCYGNNEIGTVQPIAEIVEICHRLGVLVHLDAVQAPGMLTLDVEELGVDLLSLSGHKFGGPKGIGVLYVRSDLDLAPMILGGGQQRGIRSGTENVPGAIGLAKALTLAEQERCASLDELISRRDRLIQGVLTAIPFAQITGSMNHRLANHASFVFEGISGETILLELENNDIYCSSGSACSAGSNEPSHVLTAIGFDSDLALSAVRFTLSHSTTDDEIDHVLSVIPVVNKLRQ